VNPKIYEMFIRYEPQFQYGWNKIIAAGFDSLADELSKLADELGLSQSTERRSVLWRNADGVVEAMFAYIIDSTDLDGIIAMYSDIKKMRIPVTFATIEQREDGPGQYDIFRLSEKSYLEHCNRAWVPGTSADER